MKKVISWSLLLLLALYIAPQAWAAEGNLGTATINEFYSCAVYESNGTPLTLENGSSLPPGFNLDGTVISGTPTEPGEFTFSVTDGTQSIRCFLTVVAPAGPAEDPNTVVAISLGSAPKKINYQVGDSLDTTGLTINVQYGDGHSETLSQGFTLNPTSFNATGETAVEVSYQGYTCTFGVIVENSPAEIGGVGLVMLPTKTEYKVGENLDPRGMILRVYLADMSSHYDVDTGYVCTPGSFDKPGQQTVTVNFEGKSCTFTVNVVREENPVALYIGRLPDKIEYTVGDSLDTTGLTLRLRMDSGTSTDVTSGFTCSPVMFSTAGTQKITAFYGNFTCVFNVTVKEKSDSPSPSPAPTESAAPQLPTPTPFPSSHVTEHSSHELGNRALTVVVLILSVLLLLALGAYVLVVNCGGIDGVKTQLAELLKKFGGNKK